ncbi:hypothetical protein V6N13_125407 [Hibiscus sabdariffa]
MLLQALNISLCHEEQVLNENQHDMDVVASCENQDEESTIMVAETQLGDADENRNDKNMVIISALDVMYYVAYP